jgi:hypothetical protein
MSMCLLAAGRQRRLRMAWAAHGACRARGLVADAFDRG